MSELLDTMIAQEKMSTWPVISKAKIAAKLLAVAKSVGWVEKRGKNEAQKYDYVMAADIAAELRGKLYEQGVIVTASCGTPTTKEYTSSQGKPMRITTVSVRWTFIDSESGEEISVSVPGEAMDSGDKAVYKAMTGSLKYAMMMNFLLPTGDDPEKDSASDEVYTPVAAKLPGKAPGASSSSPGPTRQAPASGAQASPPKAAVRVLDGVTVPFGKDRGKRLGEVSPDGLEWLRGVVSASIDNPAKANFKDKNMQLLASVEAELDLRAKLAEQSDAQTAQGETDFPTE